VCYEQGEGLAVSELGEGLVVSEPGNGLLKSGQVEGLFESGPGVGLLGSGQGVEQSGPVQIDNNGHYVIHQHVQANRWRTHSLGPISLSIAISLVNLGGQHTIHAI
jgi:hypothetical protein